MRFAYFKTAAAAVAASAMASQAFAAGFMLTEQSAGSMGRAYAGVGVDGTEISGVYYNPAAMVLHPGTKIQMGFVGIGLNLDYADANDSSADANGRYKPQAIPFGYITHQINDSVWFGLAMTVPFGMGTEYDSNWKHADHGISATILTYDFNPNFAWKLNEKFSIGAGVSLQYAKADLKKDSYLANQTNNFLRDSTVRSEIKADSWAWGFNVGLMWSPLETLRLGLSYRSQIRHDAEGDLTLDRVKIGSYDNSSLERSALNTILSGLSSYLGTTDGYATVTAPAWALASIAWDVNDLLSLYASFRWTDWSSFDKLEIEGGNGVGETINNNWRDTYLGALGADLRLTSWWTLRGGIAYESSPIANKLTRTAIIPDADRWWFAVGSSFKVTDNFQWDISFAHLHGVHERSLYDAYGQELGKFRKLDAYLLGTQFVYTF